MIQYNRLFIIAWFLFLLLAACNTNENKSDLNNEQLQVFTTIFPLEDFARVIGGEHVHVTNLIPVGADAHTFEPTAREMIEVAEGDMFIYNGAGLEGFVTALLESIQNEQVIIVEATENIELLSIQTEKGQTAYDEDPHVWLDPMMAIEMAASIKDAFIQVRPELAQSFTANFEQLKEDLLEIDEQFKEMVANAKKDTFLVSHQGYSYWEKRYGIKQMSITGLSPTNEPTQRQLEQLITKAKEEQIQYVLFEKGLHTKMDDVVKDALGADVLYLHNLETLQEENIESGETYISLMKKNIDALQKALQ